MIKSFFTVNSAADIFLRSLIIFSSVFGIGGMLISRDSRMEGLVTGVVMGGIMGLSLGAIGALGIIAQGFIQ